MAGFHDAYVAAPSRAAALRAWGATTDLFAMDAAEQVTDPKLMAEPLANPGKVIRQSRGSEKEHMAAAAGPAPKSKAEAASSPKPMRPRPSRADLEKVEKRLEREEAEHATQNEALEEEVAAIHKRQDAARRAFNAKQSKLEAARQVEVEAYEKALKDWRAS